MKIGAVFQFEIPPYIALNRDGSTVTRLAQCTSISQLKNTRYKVEGLSYRANIPANVDFYISQNKVDYNLANDPEFNSIPDFANNVAREYVIVVNAGVLIGASSTANYAFTQGAFPSGSTLKIINAGEIIGAGGDGGRGGFAYWETGITPDPISQNGVAGKDAGNAFSMSTDCVIDNLTGLFGGGGGGVTGSSSQAGSDPNDAVAGDGGDGGAGSVPGKGGVAGKSETPLVLITGEVGVDGNKLFSGLLAGDLGQDATFGGSGGDAIHTNGFNVTIVAGNNSNQIKGDVV